MNKPNIMNKSILQICFQLVIAFVCIPLVAQNTTLIQDVNPGPNGSVIGLSASLGDNVYYTGFRAGQFGREVFRYDATTGDVNPITSPSQLSFPGALYSNSTDVFLIADDGLYQLDQSDESFDLVFETTGSADVERIFLSDDFMVIETESSFKETLHYFDYKNNKQSVIVADVSTGTRDFAVSFGNVYSAILLDGGFSFSRENNFIIENSTGDIKDYGELTGTICDEYYRYFAADDFLFATCDGDIVGYDLSANASIEMPGDIFGMTHSDTHVFLRLRVSNSIKLYSLNNTTAELLDLDLSISEMGAVCPADQLLYVASNSRLHTSDGTTVTSVADDTFLPQESIIIRKVEEIQGNKLFLLERTAGSEFDIYRVTSDQMLRRMTFPSIDLGSSIEMLFHKVGERVVITQDDATYGEELFEIDSYVTASEDFEDANINLYPNPVYSTLNIAVESDAIISIDLYDVQGRLLVIDMIKQGSNTVSVDLNSLPAGLYFCKAVSSSGSQVVKRVYKK